MLLTFISSRVYSQTMTGFTSPHDNCSSAPTVNLTTGDCNPITDVVSYTTNVIMSDATTSTEGVEPTSCTASPFAGSAMAGASVDKWIRIVTGSSIEGIAFRTSNFTIGVPSETTTANYYVALYQGTSCPGGSTNPITMQWSAHTPTGSACTSAAISTGASASNAPYYINVSPNTTYYVRIFSLNANAGYNFNLEILPLPAPPANGNNQGANLAAAQAAPCSNSAVLTASTTGCNYGAIPAPWNSGSSPVTPTGCSWFRAENSQFYRFSRPVGQFTVEINNINCTGGGNSMQTAVFSGCPNGSGGSFSNQVGNCVVTSGGRNRHVINDGGVAGTTYYIWVDGNAGSVCNYGIYQSDGLLPIELLDFKANIHTDKSVLLNWQTASELRNEKFIIERSGNGVDFYAIGEVKGNGTTQEKQDYEFLDAKPKPGILYYRLRQVDYDGKYEIHKTISTEISVDDFIIFPNPAREYISLSFKNIELIPEKIELMNYTGSLIESNMIKENGIYSFDIKHLPKGIYFFKVFYNHTIQVENFVIGQ